MKPLRQRISRPVCAFQTLTVPSLAPVAMRSPSELQVIDFTVPEATMFHAKKCYENNMSIVIGTTGLDNQQEEELLNLSKKIPIVYSANFSIGVTLLSSLVADATKSLGKEWDIEILEMHHKQKIDAPSGTALMLGKSASEARGQDLSSVKAVSRNGIVGKRGSGEIGFAVLRGGDVVGEHESGHPCDQGG